MKQEIHCVSRSRRSLRVFVVVAFLTVWVAGIGPWSAALAQSCASGRCTPYAPWQRVSNAAPPAPRQSSHGQSAVTQAGHAASAQPTGSPRVVRSAHHAPLEPTPDPSLHAGSGYAEPMMPHDGAALADCGCGTTEVFASCGDSCAIDGWCGGGSCWHDPVCFSGGPSLQRRLWFSGEYMLWWFKGMDVPPLVTTSATPANPGDATERNNAGVLSNATTRVLYGRDQINTDPSSGARIGFGYWIKPGCWSVETNYLVFGDETETFSRNSTGTPILARPFLNITTGDQDAGLIAYPNWVRGSIDVRASTRLQGTEVLSRHVWFRKPNAWLDFLWGYRFVQLDDDLRFHEVTESLDAGSGVPVGTVLDLTDEFSTQTDFHGATLGFAAHARRKRWTFSLLMKLSLGTSTSQIRIDGNTTTTPPGTTTNQGLYAMNSNIGLYEQADFAFMPELGMQVAYDIFPRLRAKFGYSLLFWSRVARAGDQIDFDINPTQLIPGAFEGAGKPEIDSNMTEFWAQGFNFGLEYRY